MQIAPPRGGVATLDAARQAPAEGLFVGERFNVICPLRYVQPLAVARMPTCGRHTCCPVEGQMPHATPGPAPTPDSAPSEVPRRAWGSARRGSGRVWRRFGAAGAALLRMAPD